MTSTIRRPSGFTLIELTVIIVVIGILAGISAIGYSGWQKRSAETAVKNDLSNVKSAMENARNFGNAYPASLPAGFRASEGVNVTYVSGSAGEYCINAVSTRDSTVKFFLNSTSGEVVSGQCS